MSAGPSADQGRIGCVIGEKYRLVRLLGAGGMGAVYEARNTWTRRGVAIKILRSELLADHDLVRRFVQEAQTTTQIAHPNIVDILDLGQDRATGDFYMVQELLGGLDLRERMDQSPPLSVGESLGIVVPVMRALVAAHACNIVHRDIKPENVFLARGPDGKVTPKLIDFGISKILASGASTSQSHTVAGTVVGTPAYMSPEQVRGSPIDVRSDVWGLGALLYEVLAGQPIFTATTPQMVAIKIMTQSPEPLTKLLPGIAPALAAAVQRALEREPDDRFAGMQEFLDAVLAVVPERPFSPIVTLPPAAAVPRPGAASAGSDPAWAWSGKPRRARWVGPLLGGVLGLLVLGAGAAILLRGRGALPPAEHEAAAPKQADPVGAPVLALEPGRAGTVELSSKPAGAEVLVGDRNVGITPLSLAVVRGSVLRVTLRKRGYEDLRVELSAQPAERTVVLRRAGAGGPSSVRPAAAAAPATAPAAAAAAAAAAPPDPVSIEAPRMLLGPHRADFPPEVEWSDVYAELRYRICTSATGAVIRVVPLRSGIPAGVNGAARRALAKRQYGRHLVAGEAVPACFDDVIAFSRETE
jgi:serine/threonine-protein kinase